MKSRSENNNESILHKNSFEEIADIPDSIARSAVIDGEDDFEEGSIVELDLNDFEELGSIDNNYLKSMTIIDEFESDLAKNNTLLNKNSTSTKSIDLEQLTIQIDSLTSVKKPRKVIMPGKDFVSNEIKKEKEHKKETAVESDQKDIVEIEQDEIEIIEIKHEDDIKDGLEKKPTFKPETKHGEYIQEKPEEKPQVKPVENEIAKDRINNIFETITQDDNKKNNYVNILRGKNDNLPGETKENKSADDLKDTNKNLFTIEIPDKLLEELPASFNINELSNINLNEAEIIAEEHIIESKIDIPPEETKEKEQTETLKESKENIFTILIPEKLLEKLPENFNIGDFGKINLNEAEIIAEEDLLSLTRGDLFKELEGLIVPTERNPENLGIKENTDLESEQKKVRKKGYKTKDTVKDEIEKPEEKSKKEKIEKKEKLTDTIAETIKEENVKSDLASTEKSEQPDVAVRTEIEEKSVITPTPDVDAEAVTQSKVNATGKEIKDENVLIIDNNKFIISESGFHNPDIDELENISSGMVDVIGGKVKQLTESDVMDRKTITSLIRDNYPTFKDLLKEKEIKDKHTYSDDDIAFVDDSFLTNNKIEKLSYYKGSSDNLIKEKITTPYEQILGLIPDEINFIENQLFNRKIDHATADLKNAGLDQHPSDTMTLSKYKYILPVPDSLLDDERKSIEDDISAESALILEEDVEKIKKKLDDSIKKETAETIDDITDSITIYDNSKNNNKAIDADLEDKEISRSHLDELFNKSPEEKNRF
ncbi:MAG: hypothetical protein JXN64_01870 [Spirochaetes bacterium]|nr:hypothetical protein [Spirochaetota bacterium]